MGGNMQPQGHLQTIVRMLDYGQNPQAACDAPRWRFNAGLGDQRRAADGPGDGAGAAARAATASKSINDSYQDFGAGQFIWRAGDPERRRLRGGVATRAATAWPRASEAGAEALGSRLRGNDSDTRLSSPRRREPEVVVPAKAGTQGVVPAAAETPRVVVPAETPSCRPRGGGDPRRPSLTGRSPRTDRPNPDCARARATASRAGSTS